MCSRTLKLIRLKVLGVNFQVLISVLVVHMSYIGIISD